VKVKELLRLLASQDPEAEVVLITLEGEYGVSLVESQPGDRVFIYSDEEDDH
jgi:hypothetical protein